MKNSFTLIAFITAVALHLIIGGMLLMNVDFSLPTEKPREAIINASVVSQKLFDDLAQRKKDKALAAQHKKEQERKEKERIKRAEERRKEKEAERINASRAEALRKKEEAARLQTEKIAKAKAAKEAKALAVKEAKAQAAKEAKALAVKEAKAQAAKEAKALAVKEAKAQAAKEAKALAVKEAKAQAAKEAKALAVKEAKAQAAKEAKALAVKEAKAQAAKEAKALAAEKAKLKAEAEKTRLRQAELEKLMDEEFEDSFSSAQSSKHLSELARYKALIQDKISRNWQVDVNMKGKTCTLTIRLASDGLVLQANSSSGDEKLCASAKRAAFKAKTLPIPKDPQISAQFRDFDITLEPDL